MNKTTTTYRNPWHKPGHDSPIFSTTAKAVQLGKYTRFERIPGSFDFVYQDVCFAQRAGPATEAMIDACKYAQGNLLRFCGVKFGPTWDDPREMSMLELCAGISKAAERIVSTVRK